MRGLQAAQELITDYLRSDLPTRLAWYRQYWHLSPEELPDPVNYYDYEISPEAEMPTIITLGINTLRVERNDWDDFFNPVYRVTYTMRTAVWAKAAPERDAVNNIVQAPQRTSTYLRNRLVTVVRAALIDHPALRSAPGDETLDLGVDETTMREIYGPTLRTKGDNHIAGAYLEYRFSMNEIVVRDPVGTISEVQVAADSID